MAKNRIPGRRRREGGRYYGTFSKRGKTKFGGDRFAPFVGDVLPPPIVVASARARAFALRVLGLASPHADVAAALAHHGYVQIDPINVCGRMHDHILRNRVAGYREGDLLRFLHEPGTGRRTAFEHHLPTTGILVALEADAWPHLRAAMRARTRRAGAWSGRLTPREAELSKPILEALAERGPLGSDAVDDPRPGRRAWGAATLVKATLQKLFFHGRVLIARREGGRRLYDLPERVLPAEVLALPEAEPEATARWEALLKLRQRRLTALKRAELAAVADRVRPVRIEGVAGLFYVLREDEETLAAADAVTIKPRLLAPLDPLIYDRALTRRLWDFDYTWEVYTPPAKRRRGYYALPLLAGAELAGHVEPKADRKGGRLEVIGREARRGRAGAATAATRDLAAFLGLRV